MAKPQGSEETVETCTVTNDGTVNREAPALVMGLGPKRSQTTQPLSSTRVRRQGACQRGSNQVLDSGNGGSVHVDQATEYNEDRSY
jgi:hypothetical protein